MSRYLDIGALADAIVASVAEPVVEKTASAPSEGHTEIGRALKLAASKIRDFDDSIVDNTDLEALISSVAKHAEATAGATLGALSGTPAGGAMAGGMGGNNPINASAPGPAPSNPTGQIAPKLGSIAGDELRKLAAVIRKQGEVDHERRMLKAAQMITAATGLKHLTASLKG
jgi:hypothetical protein